MRFTWVQRLYTRMYTFWDSADALDKVKILGHFDWTGDANATWDPFTIDQAGPAAAADSAAKDNADAAIKYLNSDMLFHLQI